MKQFVEVHSESKKMHRLLQLLGEWSEHGSAQRLHDRSVFCQKTHLCFHASQDPSTLSDRGNTLVVDKNKKTQLIMTLNLFDQVYIIQM